LNGDLLNVRQHLYDNLAIALKHAQNRWFFFRQSTAPTFPFELSSSSLAFFARNNGWISFMTSRNVDFIGFNLTA
jgi:hypothetical protein